MLQRELLPGPTSFYERELGKLSRPSRGWARGNCPFHKSKSGLSFSVNVDTGGFYCFGCEAKGGDVIAFLMKRDSMNFKQAAMELGVWRIPLTLPERRDIEERKRKREQERLAAQDKEEQRRRSRIDACDRLHRLERVYEMARRRLTALRKEDDSQLDSDFAATLMDFMSDSLWEIREAAAKYAELAGVGNGD